MASVREVVDGFAAQGRQVVSFDRCAAAVRGAPAATNFCGAVRATPGDSR